MNACVDMSRHVIFPTHPLVFTAFSDALTSSSIADIIRIIASRRDHAAADADAEDDDDDFKPFDVPSKEEEEEEKDASEDDAEAAPQKKGKTDKKAHVAFKKDAVDDDEDDEEEEIVNLDDLGALLDADMDDEEKAAFDAAVGAAQESEEALVTYTTATCPCNKHTFHMMQNILFLCDIYSST